MKKNSYFIKFITKFEKKTMSTKESNKYSNEIQNKKIGSKKFQVKIEKDISNIL